LVGPAHLADGLTGRVIRAPGNDVWLFARWLVEGPSDLANSHAMQDRLEVLAPQGANRAKRISPNHSTDAENFLAVANESLAHNPPPASEAAEIERWASVGLRDGRAPMPLVARLSRTRKAALTPIAARPEVRKRPRKPGLGRRHPAIVWRAGLKANPR
jgi:hypothetical protein